MIGKTDGCRYSFGVWPSSSAMCISSLAVRAATFFYTRWPANLALVLPSKTATRSASNATQCKCVLATCSLVGEQLAPWSVSNAKPACPSQYPFYSTKNFHSFVLGMSWIWNLSGCACNVFFNSPFFKRLLTKCCGATGQMSERCDKHRLQSRGR